MFRRTDQFRVAMSKAGYARMFVVRQRLNWLYNQALEYMIQRYKEQGESTSFYDLCQWLTGLRAEHKWLSSIAVGAQRGMLKRVSNAMQAFFRRLKQGRKPGFPRFKPLARCVTLDLLGTGNVKVHPAGKGYVLTCKGLPRMRLFGSLELLGKPILVRLTFHGRHWLASVVGEHVPKALPASHLAVGMDLGIRKRLTLSTGEVFPRGQRNDARARKLARAASRCQKGSRTRRKRYARLARHRRRERIRVRNECHRITTAIIHMFGGICVEDLKIMNMTRSARGTVEEPGQNVNAKKGLNREIHKQNWGLLIQQLTYKAAWAGRELIQVDPKFTSQTCYECGQRTNPKASETFRCGYCGHVADRDVNAARNILAAGNFAVESLTWAIAPGVDSESYAGRLAA